jgi:hypothetical protein
MVWQNYLAVEGENVGYQVFGHFAVLPHAKEDVSINAFQIGVVKLGIGLAVHS